MLTKSATVGFCCCQAMGLLLGCARVESGGGAAGDGGGPGGGPSGGAGTGAGGTRAGGQGGGSGGVGAGCDDVTGICPGPDAGVCGLSKFSLEKLPPDVLIVLDQSTSMNEQIMPVMDLGGLLNCLIMACPSKWTDMTGAINNFVTASDGQINWGIKFYPDDGTCGVTDMVAVAVGARTAAAVRAAIAATPRNGILATPTSAALQSAGRYLMGLTDPSPRYVVLATDGLPNCGGGIDTMTTDDAAAVAAVAALASAGIPVFVIGVSTQGADDTTLSNMANAGGKPRMATPPYYPVSTGAELTAALTAIGGQIASCSFTVARPDPPADPNNVAVKADGSRIPKSDTDGWRYGPNMTSIELTGSWCAHVQDGTIKNVEATFACRDVVIP